MGFEMKGRVCWHLYPFQSLCGLVRRVYARFGQPITYRPIGRMCMGCKQFWPDEA